MATLLEPVGPEGPRVYWRRRIVVLLVVLALVLLLVRACSGGGDEDPAGSSNPATGGASPTAASSTPSKSSGPSPSTTRRATTSPTAVATCKDSDVRVTARPVRSSYAVGDKVTISYVVATTGGVTCKRDVGGTANEVKVLQNGRVIWSSDFCSPGGEKDLRTLGPDDSFTVLVDWDGDVTTAACADSRLPAPAGDYQVQGRNGPVTGPTAPLTLG